jgi:hypothetical protein
MTFPSSTALILPVSIFRATAAVKFAYRFCLGIFTVGVIIQYISSEISINLKRKSSMIKLPRPVE